MERLNRETLVALGLLSGLAWIAGVLLVATQADSDPVGAHYDSFNRLLTPALALLLMSSLAFRARVKSAGKAGLLPLTIAVGGFALYLAGNLIEFWGAVLADLPTENAAERTGATESWDGSFPGFLVFLAGGLVTVGSFIAFAVRLGRWPGVALPLRLAIGASGLLLAVATALWAVSPLAALVPAMLFAFAWLGLATVVGGPSAEAPVGRPAGRMA